MVSPSRFQWKIWWLALTAAAIYILYWVVGRFGGLLLDALAFLKPVVIPLAVAGILAYLLDPVVCWLTRRRIPRLWAVVTVFATILAILASLVLWVVPTIHDQGETFSRKLPVYSKQAQALVLSTIDRIKHVAELPVFQPKSPAADAADPFNVNTYISNSVNEGINWLQSNATGLVGSIGKFIQSGIGSAWGVLGVLLSLVLVPVFLFFFLNDGPQIAATWSNYLPLRASPLKNEIVSLLSEINSYLISFFRGQLLVSLIDGLLIGLALLIMGLDFALLIGILVGVLGLIPYLGMLICWIPAVLMATAQFGDWGHPLAVTIIFIVANQVDGLLIAPKIVGESVGLHPLTVIISVLAWSIVLGGLLGALLAVPLTATLKVLLKRYFWDKSAQESPPV
jgi:predicted PurR-regulated permease PerM